MLQKKTPYCAKQDDANLIIGSGVDSIHYLCSDAFEGDQERHVPVLISLQHAGSAVDSIDGQLLQIELFLLPVRLARRAHSLSRCSFPTYGCLVVFILFLIAK